MCVLCVVCCVLVITGLTVKPCATQADLLHDLSNAMQLRVVGSHRINERCEVAELEVGMGVGLGVQPCLHPQTRDDTQW